jgi:SAM-dependent methyltransferase
VLDQNLRYYGFGVKVGVSNLAHNGLALGLRRTIGKIVQPVNYYGRFPQYRFIGERVERYLASFPGIRAKILDVGSPKLLGLCLAWRYAVDLQLTDISRLDIDEYRLLWNSIKRRARGTAAFCLQDARALPHPPATFDVAYSMSVVEHVEGANGDSASVRELIRVLKPGGLLLLTVPFGTHYVEQQRIGLRNTDERSGDDRSHFYQRIYDQAACETRLLMEIGQLQNVSLTTVYHRFPLFAQLWECQGATFEVFWGSLIPGFPPWSAGRVKDFAIKRVADMARFLRLAKSTVT